MKKVIMSLIVSILVLAGCSQYPTGDTLQNPTYAAQALLDIVYQKDMSQSKALLGMTEAEFKTYVENDLINNTYMKNIQSGFSIGDKKASKEELFYDIKGNLLLIYPQITDYKIEEVSNGQDKDSVVITVLIHSLDQDAMSYKYNQKYKELTTATNINYEDGNITQLEKDSILSALAWNSFFSTYATPIASYETKEELEFVKDKNGNYIPTEESILKLIRKPTGIRYEEE